MVASLIKDLMANQFARLAGLHISGTIPLQQELVNQALSELVENRSSTGGQQRPHIRKIRPAADGSCRAGQKDSGPRRAGSDLCRFRHRSLKF